MNKTFCRKSFKFVATTLLYLLNHVCLGRRGGDGLHRGYRCNAGRGQGGCIWCSRPCCHSHVPRLLLLLCMMMVRLMLLVVRRVRLVCIQLSSIAIVLAAWWTRNTKARKEACPTFCDRATRYSSGDRGCRGRRDGHDRPCSIAQIGKSRRWLQDIKLLINPIWDFHQKKCSAISQKSWIKINTRFTSARRAHSTMQVLWHTWFWKALVWLDAADGSNKSWLAAVKCNSWWFPLLGTLLDSEVSSKAPADAPCEPNADDYNSTG